MKRIAPDYYPRFACIASKCRHSCCIGWEIDIDSDTLAYYKSIGGAFGERLKKNMDAGEEAHFILDQEERCPFLNEEGLCDIILHLGEDSLCDICSDHPRFRNWFSDRVEIGLGLCCEEAGRLILGNAEKMRLLVLEDDGETEELTDWEKKLLEIREALFGIVQNREKAINRRVEEMLRRAGCRMPSATLSEWAEKLMALERLDDSWGDALERLKTWEFSSPALPAELEPAFEQLLCYFLYRHIPDARDDAGIAATAGFASLGYKIISALCQDKLKSDGHCTLEDIVECARMFSSEIEYSDENKDILMDVFKNNA